MSTAKPKGRFNADFKAYAAELDAFNERRERIVKASRDVTSASKKLIFELHRLNLSNTSTLLPSTAATLLSIRRAIATRIIAELPPAAAIRFHRAYSPGLQEYIEARTFHAFLDSATLPTRQQLEAELRDACHDQPPAHPFVLEPTDYLLGIADLTGELMRRAVADAARSDAPALNKVAAFMIRIEQGFNSFERAGGNGWPAFLSKDFPQKMKVFRTSLHKVEKSCYGIAVRRAEFKNKGIATNLDVEGEAAPKRQRVDQPPVVKRQRVDHSVTS